jgi:predicted acyltransferase
VKQGALAIFIGKVGHIHSANKKIYGLSFICLASPVRRIKIAALIVLLQHKGHKRISKVQKQFLPRFA